MPHGQSPALPPPTSMAQEAGVDMGGLTKELVETVVAAGFDRNRGLFCATPDGFAYPNPLAGKALPHSATAPRARNGTLGVGSSALVPAAGLYLSSSNSGQ